MTAYIFKNQSMKLLNVATLYLYISFQRKDTSRNLIPQKNVIIIIFLFIHVTSV